VGCQCMAVRLSHGSGGASGIAGRIGTGELLLSLIVHGSGERESSCESDLSCQRDTSAGGMRGRPKLIPLHHVTWSIDLFVALTFRNVDPSLTSWWPLFVVSIDAGWNHFDRALKQ
jgi:hypothetical protein